MILVADTKSFEDFAKDMNRAIEPRVSTSEPICIPMGDLDFIFKLQNTEEPGSNPSLKLHMLIDSVPTV